MVDKPASEQIDDIIASYGGWKGRILAQLRTIITQADPEIIEEVKWKTASRPEGLPVWSRDGILCIAETWKDNVKLIFFKGALLEDSDNLFNARLNSRMDRAIEYHEHDSINGTALKALVLQASALNASKAR